jgi:hypothetical protein
MFVRSCRAARWLVAATLVWGVLALVARVPAGEASAVTGVLFILALAFTYVAVLGAAVDASARRRLALLRAAALTLGLVITVAVLEVAAAARLVHWELVLASLGGEGERYVADPELGFRHTPNLRRAGRVRSDIETAWQLPASRSDAITITYDGLGYRNPRTPTRADVVLIGDSYLAGDYVSDDEVVSRLLETRLGRPVANLGVAGYGPAQELIALRRDAMPLGPGTVIWFFFEGNDLYNDHQFENVLLAPREVRATAWTTQHRWWRRSLLRSAHAQLRLALAPIVPGHCPHFGIVTAGPHRGEKVLFWPEAAVPWTAFEQAQWEKTRRTLRTAAAETRAHGARLLLVYVPIKFRVYRDFIDVPPGSEVRDWTLWPLPELFARFCRDEGLACLDLTGPFRDAVRAGGMPHASTDSHWSAEGHRLVADRLTETLAWLGRGAPRHEGGTPR